MQDKNMNARLFKAIVNFWPPLLFSGIKVTYLAPDYQETRVTLKLRWYNRNYVGTQYGGSLISMTDPWYMLMLMTNLGRDYFVWDKHAEIDYISPGKTHVHAQFKIANEVIEEIRAKTANGEKFIPEFIVDIKDENDKLVARVKRRVYVKLKPRARTNEKMEQNDVDQEDFNNP
jgi:acyl-coenzyme A thioesterase PaaI-like protein